MIQIPPRAGFVVHNQGSPYGRMHTYSREPVCHCTHSCSDTVVRVRRYANVRISRYILFQCSKLRQSHSRCSRRGRRRRKRRGEWIGRRRIELYRRRRRLWRRRPDVDGCCVASWRQRDRGDITAHRIHADLHRTLGYHAAYIHRNADGEHHPFLSRGITAMLIVQSFHEIRDADPDTTDIIG